MNHQPNILEELMSISPALATLPKNNVYAVPDEYFSQLSNCVLDKLWLADSKQKTPTGYFDSFADKLMQRIKSEATISELEIPQWLNDLKKQRTFQVPNDYFATLSSRLTENAIGDNDQSLKAIAGATPYQVPENYFNDLPVQILQQTNTARVVKMAPVKRVLQWAAAAVVTGIIAGAIYFYTQKATGNEALMAGIEEGIKMNNQQFDEKLNNLTDDEISQYLQHYGNESDMQQITASIDDDGMETTEAPLTDEKLMEEMLNVLDGKSTSN